jgi:hypothetical protein
LKPEKSSNDNVEETENSTKNNSRYFGGTTFSIRMTRYLKGATGSR